MTTLCDIEAADETEVFLNIRVIFFAGVDFQQLFVEPHILICL